MGKEIVVHLQGTCFRSFEKSTQMGECVVYTLYFFLNFLMNLGDIVNNDLMWNPKPILDSFNKAKALHYHILGNYFCTLLNFINKCVPIAKIASSATWPSSSSSWSS